MSRTLEKPKTRTAASPEAPGRKKETGRDLVEQIVVAFILAFLIRGFEAEAFVIPTGSMAPTLYGQHKEVTCRQCGELFAVNAAEEAETNRAGRPGQMVNSATCPNCRFRVTNLSELPSFKGDRILVMKFLYNLPPWLGGRAPARWDVVVFHYPEEPETNYIKRLIGLPGELLRIYYGNILTKSPSSNEPFRIQRKPLPQQQAMQQLVWDDSHRPKAFADRPEWNRWGAKSDAWKETGASTFKTSTNGDRGKDSWSELQYRNYVPDPAQWEAALTGKPIPGGPRATLITDFYGYNSGATSDARSDASGWFQPHWVGDLTVSARFLAKAGTGGKVRLELVEGGVAHRCVVDLETGEAILSRDGKALSNPVPTLLRADGKSHDVAFANVDDRLTLWVDGKTPFGDGITFETDPEKHLSPTAADLVPVTIAFQHADLEVSGLVLKRDIYYTQDPGYSDYSGLSVPWPAGSGDPEKKIAETFDLLADPTKFAVLGELKWKDYPIEPGRYMMMGDNSPRSKDSRGWSQGDAHGYYDTLRDIRVEPWSKPEDRSTWEVPESLLIGKAFFVYWPHGVPMWPNIKLGRDFRIPFRPYVERMKWIR
ncbi:MAG: lepB [Planctomycetota bacterium]|nr:lepB [Planctomycetota bacterium]